MTAMDPSTGAIVLKFTKGFGELANLNLDRFNDKVRAKEPIIQAAFGDDQAKYVLVPIHTGAQDFGAEPRQDLNDCLNLYNDTSNPDATELLSIRILKQSDVHGMMARGVQARPLIWILPCLSGARPRIHSPFMGRSKQQTSRGGGKAIIRKLSRRTFACSWERILK